MAASLTLKQNWIFLLFGSAAPVKPENWIHLFKKVWKLLNVTFGMRGFEPQSIAFNAIAEPFSSEFTLSLPNFKKIKLKLPIHLLIYIDIFFKMKLCIINHNRSFRIIKVNNNIITLKSVNAV